MDYQMFPEISADLRLQQLQPPEGNIRMVLDTDTYNEIDDQFAVVHALLSPKRLDMEAVYAAPFHNDRSSGPADGMEKSYQEILRLLGFMGIESQGRVFRGSTTYLSDAETACESDAVTDLVERAAVAHDSPLYVVAIGAITNVASAILARPEIIENIVVVWLGGHALHWQDTREFNLMQDIPAARVVFDCGVPLVHIPCNGVTTHLHTTVPELEAHVAGRGAIGDYLVEIFKAYHEDHYAWSKVIWDIATIAWLVNPAWVPTELVHSPVVTDQLTWSVDRSRHFIRSAFRLDRDAIFRDLFTKLDRGQK